MRNFATLTRMRIQLTLRNKMFLFFSVIMPFGFFFLYAGVFAKGQPAGVRFFLGPVVALAVMGSFWGLSAALVMFREQGILRRFHVTPVTASDMLASSIVANYVLIFPTVLLQFVFARTIFHVTHFGDLFATFILISIGNIAFASLGLVVASVTNTMQETQVINQLIWLPLIFLSGATFPLAFLPQVVQKVSLFLPATYLVQGLSRTIFRICAHLGPQRPYLSGFPGLLGCTYFFLSAQLFRWEPEVKVPRKAKLLVLATIIPFLLLGFWENTYGNIPAQAQSALDSLSAPAKSAPPPDSANPPDLPSVNWRFGFRETLRAKLVFALATAFSTLSLTLSARVPYSALSGNTASGATKKDTTCPSKRPKKSGTTESGSTGKTPPFTSFPTS